MNIERINLDFDIDKNIDLFKKMADDSYVDIEEELEKPPIALSIGTVKYGNEVYDKPFGTFGNFSCIVGESKSKKTFLKSLFVASFIGGKTIEYGKDIAGKRTKDMFILDFDTEQGKWHSQRAFKRVTQMVGSNYEYYKPFYLRRYTHRERIDFIEYMILESEYRDNIGLVAIDGFADLLSDVNNLEEANLLTQKILKWTDMSKCHLLGVLHNNYGSDKPTGHLGSAILKKSETVCVVKSDAGIGDYVNVKFTHTRSWNLDDFKFYIDNYGLPRIV